MKIILTIKSNKGIHTTPKENDFIVEKILEVGSYLEKKFGGVKMGRCKCLEDGTTLIIEN